MDFLLGGGLERSGRVGLQQGAAWGSCSLEGFWRGGHGQLKQGKTQPASQGSVHWAARSTASVLFYFFPHSTIMKIKIRQSLPSRIIPTAAAAKSLQSCLTLCNPIDSSPPGSPVPGILQARTLEWVAISFSNA